MRYRGGGFGRRWTSNFGKRAGRSFSKKKKKNRCGVDDRQTQLQRAVPASPTRSFHSRRKLNPSLRNTVSHKIPVLLCLLETDFSQFVCSLNRCPLYFFQKCPLTFYFLVRTESVRHGQPAFHFYSCTYLNTAFVLLFPLSFSRCRAK